MKPYKLLLLFTCLALILSACVRAVAPPAKQAARLDPETVAKIEALIKKTMAEHKIPGFAIGIVKDGQVTYTKGFGVAEAGTDKPVTPQSLFQMASISKTFTALAIMQLVEQGKIDLNAPVTDYLPYFTMADTRYRDITVRQLLNHTSGLSDDFGHEFKDTTDPMAQAVRDLADQKLLATPGEKWFYSGVAFALLGEVIAGVSGMDFESYMQKHVLGPLGMSHSTFVPGKADAKLLVIPHINAEAGGVKASTIVECDARRQAACTLYSSCDDMIKYARFALNRGDLDGVRLVSRRTFDELWKSQASTPWLEGMGPHYGAPMAEYGLGWLLGEAEGHRLAGHPGGVAGWNSQIQLAIDDGLAVIAMDNWQDKGPYSASFAAIDVLYQLLGIEPEPAAQAYQPRYEAAACKYPVPDGEKMECGYLTVPEDRSKPGGPTVRLHVTNLKSTNAKPAPDPVFIVAGGAGTSGMVYMNVIRNLAFGKALRAERDVIFLDQRGTNFSEPALYCPELAINPADVAGLPLAEEVTARVGKIRACHDRLVKEGINLGAYNEREIAADYADLRVAMGYDQVNLYGMSLGSRLAMIAMREHPEGLRSVVLDSVLPPEVSILASDLPGVQAALKTLFGACAADAACNKAFPALEAAFYEVAGRLRAAPVQVEVTTDKGEHFKVAVDDLSFVEFVLESLFNRAIAPMPGSIYAAKTGDYTAVAKARLAPTRLRQAGEAGPGSMADAYGHWFSFWCTGDGGGISDADLNAAFGVAGLNPSVRDRSWAIRVEAIHAPCKYWGVPALDPRVADQSVTSDIPTLLLEGTFDFFTEPSLVQTAAKRLSKSYFYSLPTGHLIAWFSPCGDKLVIDFLRDPTKAPDASCIGEMRVAWVLPK